uniref:Uncharacterized protein n=1 Tax=Siphoviridae sp. ctxZP4 TaxID=2823611 RepID=A0A8S5LGW4_9CAUD|nr:MAG TPA: hypothetical protein [Siphoviridae sp. ctxZP4]
MSDNVPVRGDLPSNSRKTKPAVERVVKTPARIDQGSLGRQALQAFFAEDIKEVGQYLLWDIALPSVKNAVSDIFTSGIDRLLFGGDGGPQRSRSNKTYTSYSNRTYGRRETPTERTYTQRDRRDHNLESIIFATRSEAEDVLNHLISICDQYDVATVGDLYGMAGISQSYTDENWGWRDLRSGRAVRSRNGYILDLPKPEDVR